MKPFFTIITPTIMRDSLERCCESVDGQDIEGWEHVVVVDMPTVDMSTIERLERPNRRFLFCGARHNNSGNTCRHRAWDVATGEYVIYLDDDNYLSDSNILGDIAECLHNGPSWAIFPIKRFGHHFFFDPPGVCRTDTANMVIHREIAQWPDIPDYTADGIFAEHLKVTYDYASFPAMRPIVVMPSQGKGV